jgi:FkbM family methyltransferase
MMIKESWDGFKWYIEGGHDSVVLSKGELSVLKALYTIPCETFVDVGSHVGYYAIRMAKRCKNVIAVEPNPKNREKLLKNIELNALPNVKVIPYAIGEKRYTAKFWLADTSSTLLQGYVSGVPIEVQVVPLDEVVDSADVIKIDVEAYEWKVLQGMPKLIDKYKPSLIVEHHDFRGYKINDYPKIKSFLSSLGYIDIFLTPPHHLYYHKSKNLHLIKPLIANHWIALCTINMEQRRPWYYGLPYTWWYGMNFVDFLQEIPEHIFLPDEPAWVDNLLHQ